MNIGGTKIRKRAIRGQPNVGKMVAQATTKVKSPLARGTKGLPQAPKAPRIK